MEILDMSLLLIMKDFIFFRNNLVIPYAIVVCYERIHRQQIIFSCGSMVVCAEDTPVMVTGVRSWGDPSQSA